MIYQVLVWLLKKIKIIKKVKSLIFLMVKSLHIGMGKMVFMIKQLNQVILLIKKECSGLKSLWILNLLKKLNYWDYYK